MKPGGKRRIVVPPELGPPVGPSTFFSAKQYEVFDVELRAVKSCRRAPAERCTLAVTPCTRACGGRAGALQADPCCPRVRASMLQAADGRHVFQGGVRVRGRAGARRERAVARPAVCSHRPLFFFCPV